MQLHVSIPYTKTVKLPPITVEIPAANTAAMPENQAALGVESMSSPLTTVAGGPAPAPAGGCCGQPSPVATTAGGGQVSPVNTLALQQANLRSELTNIAYAPGTNLAASLPPLPSAGVGSTTGGGAGIGSQLGGMISSLTPTVTNFMDGFGKAMSSSSSSDSDSSSDDDSSSRSSDSSTHDLSNQQIREYKQQISQDWDDIDEATSRGDAESKIDDINDLRTKLDGDDAKTAKLPDDWQPSDSSDSSSDT